MWTAIAAYSIATIAFIAGFVFRSDFLLKIGVVVAAAGLGLHTAGIVARWIRLGHGPYLGFYDVVSSYAWVALAVFLLLVWRFPTLRAAGAVFLPVVLLATGGAMLASKDASVITPTLASWWLTIHVTFAKLAFGSLTAAFALSVVYLSRERLASGALGEMLSKLPSEDVMDDLAFKFVAVGFLFLGLMIAAGAIWANEAWGRYWSWDPIETWSLIAWLTYALVLHLRLTLGWRGRRFAWAAVLALPVVAFAFIGVPTVYNSIHGAYLKGTGG